MIGTQPGPASLGSGRRQVVDENRAVIRAVSPVTYCLPSQAPNTENEVGKRIGFLLGSHCWPILHDVKPTPTRKLLNVNAREHSDVRRNFPMMPTKKQKRPRLVVRLHGSHQFKIIAWARQGSLQVAKAQNWIPLFASSNPTHGALVL